MSGGERLKKSRTSVADCRRNNPVNYYNENDPKAAAWLRELIKAGLISNGVVDERDIRAVQPTDLAGYIQCHFFAGIGGWSYALRLAGWPDDEPVWTGSCPCQPLSSAGQRKGHADERHLWPAFYELIAQCRPATVFGEQVAGKDGREWLAGVRADLEGIGYAVGAADLCAAGVGAPHIRQRLYWVADSIGSTLVIRQKDFRKTESVRRSSTRLMADADSAISDGRARSGEQPICDKDKNACWLADDSQQRRRERSSQRRRSVSGIESPEERLRPENSGQPVQLGHADEPGSQGRVERGERAGELSAGSAGAWSNFDLIPCRDGKSRRIESGTFPLAHGIPGRVGLLRGYGNAIVPQVAQAFIEAFLEA